MPSEYTAGHLAGTRKSYIFNNSSLPFPGANWSEVLASAYLSKARASNVTPGYRLKAMTGDLPENTFGFQELYYTAPLGRMFHRTFDSATAWTGSLTEGTVGSLAWSDHPWGSGKLSAIRLNQANEVRARNNKKIIDSDVDLGVVAGEFRETSRMFKDLAVRLAAAARSLRAGNVGGVATALSLRKSKDWANAWLLANYGIKPLVNDVLGGLKAIEKGMMKERYQVQSSRVVFEDSQSTQTGDLLNGLLVINWSLKCETSVRCKYLTDSSNYATLASLGLVNPAILAWELKRLSFVIDWAVGVGAWLNQLGVSSGRQFQSGSETFFQRIEGHAYYRRAGILNQVEYDQWWSAQYSEVKCERNMSISWPLAYAPAIKDPMSMFTIATSTALLRQSLR